MVSSDSEEDCCQHDQEVKHKGVKHRRRRNVVTPEEEKIMDQNSEQIHVLMWIRALVVFGILALILAFIACIIHFSLCHYLPSLTSYEIGGSFWLFPYIPVEATLFVDFDQTYLKDALLYLIILDFLILFESGIVVRKFFKPLRQMEEVLTAYEKKQFEKYDGKLRTLNFHQIEGFIDVQAQLRLLFQRMKLLSMVQTVFYLLAIYNIYCCLSGTLYKWLDDSISLQQDEAILSDFVNPHSGMAEEVRQHQRKNATSFIRVVLFIFAFVGVMVFAVLRILVLYVAYQLKTEQKKAQED
ncbi:hypothetical protein FGO68_gene14142 [Halteria grandinella]|uniref:Uncharacterized protein n=1 Tax=Halteria grandinella TaxID=5974 RepID=A0A8J8SZY5_HALGN|nr:hypothetical protein FGO68_gene14142 [Halteria grandinella]